MVHVAAIVLFQIVDDLPALTPQPVELGADLSLAASSEQVMDRLVSAPSHLQVQQDLQGSQGIDGDATAVTISAPETVSTCAGAAPRRARSSFALELRALRVPLSDEYGVKGCVGFAAGEAAKRSERSEWLLDRLVAGETPERPPGTLALGHGGGVVRIRH